MMPSEYRAKVIDLMTRTGRGYTCDELREHLGELSDKPKETSDYMGDWANRGYFTSTGFRKERVFTYTGRKPGRRGPKVCITVTQRRKFSSLERGALRVGSIWDFANGIAR